MAHTLQYLLDRIAKESDYPVFTGISRHTVTEVTNMVNESWQDMRVRVSSSGAGIMLYAKPFSGTTGVGATSPFSWRELSLQADVAHVLGMDLTLQSGRVRALESLSFARRNEWYNDISSPTVNLTGSPLYFMLYNIGVEAGVAITAGKFGLVPAPNLNYNYTMWYIPKWTDITTTTFLLDGVQGWDDYVVWDVVMKIAAADNDMANTAQIATMERQRAFDKMIDTSHDIQSTTPVVRREAQQRDDFEYESKFWER